MDISEETIDYIASLAKLELEGEEKRKVKEDLFQILGYIERMDGLDTDGIEPMSHAFPVTNVFREDAVTGSSKREELLSGAPAHKEGYIIVPKTV